ncbi:hypothetical protein AHiyo8_49460 [Arthrobacter sp. Hiyo8]|nr:hypothetical protein AHiyo8_49460 [Arthrobacter sp. Hiyo8]
MLVTAPVNEQQSGQHRGIHPGPAATLVPGLRSWWWIPAAALVFGGTVAAGMSAKGFGLRHPSLPWTSP